MSQILSATLMIINSLMFSSMMHPMNMGITLLLQTIMMAILMGLMSYSSWFSYILFLVFLGGMLVLFIYMTSIASNEMFQKSKYFSSLFMVAFIMMLLLIMLMDPFMYTMSMTNMMINNMDSPSMIMSPLYNNPMSVITMFMVLYLFLTLIVIVAITKFNKGPLRPMN
uniref:NADH-ubiquinone oxidoreductase chain 6 n=1 Tax=Orthetrum testaceum TaxID=1408535 RepID=A0A1I9NJG5_9ODON|nr:NADH dehydrogenase subunit 6 [Orthetrum testaceum]ANX10012.1 NADH dehydrogenase subunit 6 [Orthetrum testaceum]